MVPSISFEGYTPVTEAQTPPVMQELVEALSGVNSVVIDVNTNLQEREEIIAERDQVRDTLKDKFVPMRDNGNNCRFLIFSIGDSTFVTVFQQGRDEFGNNVGLVKSYTHEAVWSRISERFPDAVPLDGGRCNISKGGIMVSGTVQSIPIDRRNNMSVRNVVCGKLGWNTGSNNVKWGSGNSYKPGASRRDYFRN